MPLIADAYNHRSVVTVRQYSPMSRSLFFAEKEVAAEMHEITKSKSTGICMCLKSERLLNV